MAPATPMPELWITLLKSFGMLCIVLGLLVAVLWLLRRFYQPGSAGQDGLIRILATRFVAPKERIVLVDVLGEKLLLGVTGDKINLLAKIADEDNVCSEAPAARDSLFKSLLTRKIRARVGRRNQPNKEPSAG